MIGFLIAGVATVIVTYVLHRINTQTEDAFTYELTEQLTGVSFVVSLIFLVGAILAYYIK